MLVGASRVAKRADGGVKLIVALDNDAAQLTDLDGSRALRAGSYSVVFSSGASLHAVFVCVASLIFARLLDTPPGVASGEVALPLKIPKVCGN